jgi:hypothetical protein
MSMTAPPFDDSKIMKVIEDLNRRVLRIEEHLGMSPQPHTPRRRKRRRRLNPPPA